MSNAAATTSRNFFFDWIRPWIANTLAAASFFVYAAAVLIIHDTQRNDFVPERSSIAAGVSNVVYGAPLGTVYSGVTRRLLEMTVPLDTTLPDVAARKVPPGELVGTIKDGNGIGYVVITSLSMRLFGIHVSSVVLFMLGLIGMSALAFLLRFRDQRAVVVVLYFTTLMIMLFTPLVWDRYHAVNLTIGGIRYFSLVAILPAFHLILECADLRAPASKMTVIVPMVVQVSILLLAILTRNGAASVLGALALACGGVWWINRRVPGATSRIWGKAAGMIFVGAVLVGLLMLSVSTTYLKDGRFTEVLWHRIFLSIGLNPAWPFGNVRELYDCTHFIPEGLQPYQEDRNGHCIWWDYAIKHNIPPEVAVTMTYGREYDVALRQAFFNVLRLYPVETLKAFVYYKPQYIFSSLRQSLKLQVAGVQPALLWLLVGALCSAVTFALIQLPARSNDNLVIASVAALLAAFSTIPYFLVWAMPHTSGDLLFYCIFGLGLAGTAVITTIRKSLLPASAL